MMSGHGDYNAFIHGEKDFSGDPSIK